MTVTRRVLILIAALVQGSVMSLLFYASYDRDSQSALNSRNTLVHSATRADIDSPFTWRLDWSDWALERGGAYVYFTPDPDDPRVLSQLSGVRGLKVCTSEHWRGGCDDMADGEIGERVALLTWPRAASNPIVELPVADGLCTHVNVTLIESEPRSEIKTLHATVRGELDEQLLIGADIGMFIDKALLCVGLLSTCALVGACFVRAKPGVDEIQFALGPTSPS